MAQYTQTFEESYQLNAADYANVSLGKCPFSPLQTRLCWNFGIRTLADLLRCSPQMILIKEGLDAGFLAAVDAFLKDMTADVDARKSLIAECNAAKGKTNPSQTLAQLYRLDAKAYGTVPIASAKINPQYIRICWMSGVRTLADLLSYTTEDLARISGNDKAFKKEVLAFVLSLKQKSQQKQKTHPPRPAVEEKPQEDLQSRSESQRSFAEIYGVNARDYIDVPIRSSDVSTRIYRAFERRGITTVGELLYYSEDGLTAFDQFGMLAVAETKAYLKKVLAAKTASPTLQKEPVADVTEEAATTPLDLISYDIEDARSVPAAQSTESEEDAKTFAELLSVDPNDYEQQPIVSVDLSVRSWNVLRNQHIVTVKDLLVCTPKQLGEFRNMGATSIAEIQKYLSQIKAGKHTQKNAVRTWAQEDLDKTYAELLLVDAAMYVDVLLEDCGFSVRSYNVMRRNQMVSVADLLRTTPNRLRSMRNFGATGMREVEAYLQQIEKFGEWIDPAKAPGDLVNHAQEIARGDFSFVTSDDERHQLQPYMDAFEVVDADLLFHAYDTPTAVVPIMSAMMAFTADLRRGAAIFELVNQIPKERLKKRIYPYISAFTTVDAERNTLRELFHEEALLETVLQVLLAQMNEHTYILVKRFVTWCSFDLRAEVRSIPERLFTNENDEFVITFRAQYQTLEECGRALGVSRERIRQIEAKAKKRFAVLQKNMRILSKISAERNGDPVLTAAEIEDYFGQEQSELLYLLKTHVSADYTYDRNTDTFVIGDDSLADRAVAYVEQLPEVFRAEELPQIFEKAVEEQDLPQEMVEKLIAESYHMTGEIYHRSRLSLRMMYEEVMGKYFSNGLYIYDPLEIAKFREMVSVEYGAEIKLPKNDRNIAARLADICVLCGRGRYKPKQKSYISKDLAKRIKEYILENAKPILMINTVFTVFKEELLQEGIDNKYFLQGVLGELFGEEFFFRRDYVSKDANITSVYTSIVKYIKAAKHPVSKLQLFNEFPGITDIVISFAVDNPQILNYFGEYISADKLQLTDEEKNYLHQTVRRVLRDATPHHINEVYEIIVRERPEVLTKNGAMIAFSAFSILEYLFHEEWQFKRPYVAWYGVELERPGERLHEWIYSQNRIAISEIREWCKDNNFHIQSMIEFVNECNDRFLMTDINTIMTFDQIGIDAQMVQTIEQILKPYVTTTVPIRQLPMWHELPPLRVPWTDWLVYSLIQKWGQSMETALSFNQIKYAVPLIAPKGLIDETMLNNPKCSISSFSVQVDNLDEIDDLLEDLFDDDFLEDL